MPEKTNEGSKTFREWYARNKSKISKKRKSRYRDDPAYRDSVLRASAEWREKNPAPSRAGNSRFKMVDGVSIECMRISEVGRLIGRSDQTIRDWEAAGVIPTPSVRSAHRYYTRPQVALMRELTGLIDQLRYGDKELLQHAIATKSEEIKANWHNKE